jgi:hypothetical protein
MQLPAASESHAQLVTNMSNVLYCILHVDVYYMLMCTVMSHDVGA